MFERDEEGWWVGGPEGWKEWSARGGGHGVDDLCLGDVCVDKGADGCAKGCWGWNVGRSSIAQKRG